MTENLPNDLHEIDRAYFFHPSTHMKAHAHGESVLQRLEQIRMGLLAGRIPTQLLNELVRNLRRPRPGFTDPRLGEILDEIELRASVELAKLDHYD